ncbi:unnamed protein product [Ectocarpus sp. 6 AP-2014]
MKTTSRKNPCGTSSKNATKTTSLTLVTPRKGLWHGCDYRVGSRRISLPVGTRRPVQLKGNNTKSHRSPINAEHCTVEEPPRSIPVPLPNSYKTDTPYYIVQRFRNTSTCLC